MRWCAVKWIVPRRVLAFFVQKTFSTCMEQFEGMRMRRMRGIPLTPGSRPFDEKGKVRASQPEWPIQSLLGAARSAACSCLVPSPFITLLLRSTQISTRLSNCLPVRSLLYVFRHNPCPIVELSVWNSTPFKFRLDLFRNLLCKQNALEIGMQASALKTLGLSTGVRSRIIRPSCVR